jgi:ABC-type sugar transport system substrate-binding protein
MFRCDIAQQPYLYANMLMERAVKLITGKAKLADYVKEGTILIDTPVVTAANAQEWYDKYAKLMPKK